jgi:hypothetical protein
MREVFVSDLVKNLLGPRKGIRESLDNQHMPISEFVTGVLAPVDDKQDKNVRDNDLEGSFPISSPETRLEDDNSDEDSIVSMMNPSLNPQKTPSSMGISFQVTCDSIPEFEICLTWAKYLPDSETSPNWIRNPKYAILELSGEGDDKQYFDSSGQKCSKDDAEISFFLKSRKMGTASFYVSMFMVNVSKIQDDRQTSKYHIFQPQIRIITKQGTKIIPMQETSSDSESLGYDFLYRNRKFYARGHMTSAVWKQIDPEIISDELEKEFPESVGESGFSWTDRSLIPDEKVQSFLKPDLRTEYLPLYSIPSPDIEWQVDDDRPVLSAKEFSQMWDSSVLSESLQPIVRQYGKWITSLEKTKDGKNDLLVERIIKECKVCLSRIESGIDLLLNDDDARLAFCFANMAINLQTKWGRNEDLTYRPFQIAFVLMSIESVLRKDSEFRNTCDLLWVPTGGGKTEAYLVLVAIDMAYRRLQSLKAGKSGSGVSVFTRYTLRLLTIQQFRRSLSMFSAAEYLRVENLSDTQPTGWRPDGFSDMSDLLWGSTPFSVGLWVGQGVTPNRLGDSGGTKNGKFSPRAGALTILKQDQGAPYGEGEPAQILNCPACNNILAVPTGKDGHGVGLRSNSIHTIYWIVKSDSNESSLNAAIDSFTQQGIEIKEAKFMPLNSGNYCFCFSFKNDRNTDAKSLNYFWYQIKNHLRKNKCPADLESTSAARPGYFFKTRLNEKGRQTPYDFEVFCTCDSCPLHREWFGGAPMGGVNGTFPDPISVTSRSNGIELNDGNNLVEVQRCFKKRDFVSDRIPIPGMTVDDQVYKTLPTMIVSTVDKFARLPFEPRSGGLFGNVEYYHMLHGYYRLADDKHPEPQGKREKYYRKLNLTEIPKAPNFVIQDELHLIEGPLGSMVGLYESSVDFLSKRSTHSLKYIASTATIKRGEDQAKSLFSRKLQIFPPNGCDVDDRFFIREHEEHPLRDKSPGRLYLGVMAPGKGALTPVVRIWARLAQTAFEHKSNPEIDRFWTLTGYFNAIRELAGARSLYRQDIPDWISHLSPSGYRQLPEENSFELSGRTPSDALPSVLDMMNQQYPNAADALFTTSMFGTGVDVSRIGLMMVNGQPKTTSSYIQSTGRVGRKKGALVVVFHRATRPRDLSHYEYFIRHHRQLHRTVESPTVYPFSAGAVERSLGPIMVGMLRNMRRPTTEWHKKNSALQMRTDYSNSEINEIVNFLEDRSQSQPEKRSPVASKIYDESKRCIEKWRDVSANVNELEYWLIDNGEVPVVLGDLIHETEDAAESVFSNSPQSLRELEGETGFET